VVMPLDVASGSAGQGAGDVGEEFGDVAAAALLIQKLNRGRQARTLVDQRRKQLGAQIFKEVQAFDIDSNGFIDRDEFKAYLEIVGEWDTDDLYTDEVWASSWLTVCELLSVPEPAKGIPIDSFIKYTERYRRDRLNADIAALGDFNRVGGGNAQKKAGVHFGRGEYSAAIKLLDGAKSEVESELEAGPAPAVHGPGPEPEPNIAQPDSPPETVPRSKLHPEEPEVEPVTMPELERDTLGQSDGVARTPSPEWIGGTRVPHLQSRTLRVLRVLRGEPVSDKGYRNAQQSWAEWHNHWSECGLDDVFSMVVEMPIVHGYAMSGMASEAFEQVDADRRDCAESGDERMVLRLGQAAVLLMCETNSTDHRIARRLAALVSHLNKQAVKLTEGSADAQADAKALLERGLCITAKGICKLMSDNDTRLRLRATTLSNLGCLCRRIGKVHMALKYVEMALEIERSLEHAGGPESVYSSATTHLNLCAILLQVSTTETSS
jgi:hypothetical protein